MSNDEKATKPKLIAKLVFEIYDNGFIDNDYIAYILNEETGKKKKINGLPETEFLNHLSQHIGEDYIEKALYQKIRELIEKGKINVIP